MQSNKQISALAGAASSIQFPGVDPALNRFTAILAEVILENFGVEAASSFAYEAATRTYGFDLECFVGNVAGVGFRAARSFTINPQSIQQDLKRIEKEVKAFHEQVARAKSLLIGDK